MQNYIGIQTLLLIKGAHVKLDTKTPITISFIICILLYACAQSGSRIDEIGAKVEVMNEKIEQLKDQSGSHIKQRQDLLALIQAELQPMQEMNDSGGIEEPSPEIDTKITDNPGDIRSVPIENLEISNIKISDTDLFKLAVDAFENKEFRSAALNFSKIYESETSAADLKESSLYKAGESYYLNHEWQKSADLYVKYMSEYPDSTKMPSVLLQIGKSYHFLEEYDKSEAVLEYLKINFPNSSEALQIKR